MYGDSIAEEDAYGAGRSAGFRAGVAAARGLLGIGLAAGGLAGWAAGLFAGSGIGPVPRPAVETGARQCPPGWRAIETDDELRDAFAAGRSIRFFGRFPNRPVPAEWIADRYFTVAKNWGNDVSPRRSPIPAPEAASP